ncbi:MAG: glutathione S-transferase family protein [Parvibaculaceae bacterium]|nr:glutathione S-transferase family protein [Parvibaculaceae bacterium]
MTSAESRAILTISSKNYSSWSFRGWLLCKMAGVEFDESILSLDDPTARAELLHLSPSFLVPRLTHNGIKVWDTLAIAEYLHEVYPEAGLLPKELAARTHCRSVAGEMHSGFVNLRSALPMNIRAHFPGFKIWAGAQADIDRVVTIWHECLSTYKGPYLFGKSLTLADAMYAPVCSRFATYDVALEGPIAAYRDRILSLPAVLKWTEGAQSEPEELEELDVEF